MRWPKSRRSPSVSCPRSAVAPPSQEIPLVLPIRIMSRLGRTAKSEGEACLLSFIEERRDSNVIISIREASTEGRLSHAALQDLCNVEARRAAGFGECSVAGLRNAKDKQ